MEFRRAVYADIHTLVSLRSDMLWENQTQPEPLCTRVAENTKRFFEDSFRDESCVVWIAEENGKAAAMGCVNFFNLPPNDWCPEGCTAYIGNLYTALEYRKRGIASKIVEKLISEAKNRGCERILLNSTDRGRPLYEQQGFAVSPTAMAFYPFGIASGR
ncbi:MAG: GNAT family N-acetyltransferase [Eubacteriales bacterium]|nr:GNAT family N-acetyltransferase [Eubacteriales bacterium]